MFRLRVLPLDPTFPTEDLRSLGLFINQHDQIRRIANPWQPYQFYIDRNERYNIMHREAHDVVVRKIILNRLLSLGLQVVKLPIEGTNNGRHIPILMSRDIENCDRVILIFNEGTQDLGVWAWRAIGGQEGINAGSAIDTVKYIQTLQSSPTNDAPPGVIIANPGQLYWWRRGNKAVSIRSWDAIPRRYGTDPSPRIDDVRNRVPGNENIDAHVEYIFEHVLPHYVNNEAKLSILALEMSTLPVATYLEDNWYKLKHRMCGVVFGAPQHDESDWQNNDEIEQWMAMYSRAYILSAGVSQGEFIPMRTDRALPIGSPTYCSGTEYTETIMPTVGKDMIDYLQRVAWYYKNPPGEMFDPDLVSSEESGGEDSSLTRRRLRPAVVNRIPYGMGSAAMYAAFPGDQGEPSTSTESQETDGSGWSSD